MIQSNQQQYIQLDTTPKVSGRACFLITNLINSIVHALIIFKMLHKLTYQYWILYALMGYIFTYYALGIVSAIEQNKTVHKFYKISCIIISISHLIIFFICVIFAFYFGTTRKQSNIGDSIMFLAFIAGIILSTVELIFDYTNFKYISQVIGVSEQQQILGLSSQFAQNPINYGGYPQQFQAQMNQPYVIHYPQLQQQQQQQFPQFNNFQQSPQQIVQPINTDVINSSHTTHQQHLILQNGSQFQ